MAYQNGSSGRKNGRNVTVRAVKKDSASVGNMSAFDFESSDAANDDSKSASRSWENDIFATNDDFDFGTSEPMAVANGFNDINNGFSSDDDLDIMDVNDEDDAVEASTITRTGNHDYALEGEFYSGIDEMNKKRNTSSARKSTTSAKKSSNAKSTVSSLSAAEKRKAAAEQRRKAAKRKKILRRAGLIAAAVAVVGAASVIVYMTMFKMKAPYMIENGVSDMNSTNVGTLLEKCMSENLQNKSMTINVEGKSYTLNLADYGFGYVHDGQPDEEYINTPLEDGSYRVDKITAIGKVSFNETSVREFINTVASEHGTPMVMPSYTIEGSTLKVVPGKDGMSVDFDELTKQIINKACTGDNTPIDMQIAVLPAPAVDMQKIYREVKCDPVNASVSVGNDGVAVYVDEIVGKDFDVAAAEEIVAKGGTSWEIPLKLTPPEVTVQKLKAPSCPDTLSENSTKYSQSNENRSNNVALAGKYINGLVLQPGEIFSFNGTVGKRTKERGFKSATVYSGEGLDEDFGGGICQTSSTVYYAAIKANLEIVQRVNHYFTVGYWNMPGADATVSWGGPDLKIKNNKEYPIKFVIESGNGRITCKIMGTNTDNTEAYLEYEVTKKIPYETITKAPVKGKSNKNTSGANGMVVKTYRIVKRNGKQVSKNLEATSTYRPLNAVIYDSSAATDKTTATTTKPAATTPKPTTPAPQAEE